MFACAVFEVVEISTSVIFANSENSAANLENVRQTECFSLDDKRFQSSKFLIVLLFYNLYIHLHSSKTVSLMKNKKEKETRTLEPFVKQRSAVHY
jgi:hypothetical protein